MRSDKRGFIPGKEVDLLWRLKIEADAWHILTTWFEQRIRSKGGSEQVVQSIHMRHEYQRMSSRVDRHSLFN
ncbi:MAG TPA: hypothetical protein DCW52_04425 [Gammaproteobacteria bacterium]|nr:hypothetical protein [Gammaproteobacteria bacterium]